MYFKEFCGIKVDNHPMVQNIVQCIEQYFINFLHQQYHSIGFSNIIQEGLKIKDKNNILLEIDIKGYKTQDKVDLKIIVNEQVFLIPIDPKYFKNENIKNYMRECEIYIREKCAQIRKKNWTTNL